MNLNELPLEHSLLTDRNIAIKLVGVGGAGSNAVDRLKMENLERLQLAVINTDYQALSSSPVQDKVLSTADPVTDRGSKSTSITLRVVVSRTRPPDFVARLADTTGAVLVPLGSAGAKAAAVICGDAEAYVHSGGQYEWDSAAPVAVARAAGLHASRIDGSQLSYNQAHPWMPDILICQAALAGMLLGAISSVRYRQE